MFSSPVAAAASGHILMLDISAALSMMPSVMRNPATRSKSSPGVRIVTESETSPIRISSGSSVLTSSLRQVTAPPAATCITRVWRTVMPTTIATSHRPPAGGRSCGLGEVAAHDAGHSDDGHDQDHHLDPEEDEIRPEDADVHGSMLHRWRTGCGDERVAARERHHSRP